MRPVLPRLYLIADPDASTRRPIEQAVREALAAGVRMVQYRDKKRTVREAYRLACALRSLTSDARALFVINDRVDLALAVEADGVHLGQSDLPIDIARDILGPRRIIGISIHGVREAVEAETQGADYVAFGAVYATSSKKIGKPAGPGPIRQVAAAVSLPVFGIGGIRPEHCAELLESGAHGVAVISAIIGSRNISVSVRDFLNAHGRRPSP